MNPAWGGPRDAWIARAVSLTLHALLLLLLGRALVLPAPPSNVIFSVETVSGITPLGEGSGAPGSSDKISDAPANSNPLAGGLRLSATDAPLPQPTTQGKPKPKAAQAPSLSDLAKRYEGMRIGVQPRSGEQGEEPSEGGMGNARKAGTENGALGLDGPIAGRGYRIGDYSFGRALPEESEVMVLVTVGPKGEVVEARLKKTSGYPELDQHALAKAREIVFDALPPAVEQVNATGTVSFRFEYSGRGL